MRDRYESDPTRLRGQPDIVEYIREIYERVATSEVGLRIGHTTIEGGELQVLNGDIVVRKSDGSGDVLGTEVLRIKHGDVPEIRMFPIGETSGYQASLFGSDFDVGFGPDQSIQIAIETTDLIQDGGKVLLTINNAILSHQPDGEEETYLWLNPDPAVPEVILFRGKFRNSWQYNDHQTFYAGTFDVDPGFSTWTHTYFSLFIDQMLPIVTVNLNGSTTEWNLDNSDIAQFTIRLSNLAGGKNVHFFVVRCS